MAKLLLLFTAVPLLELYLLVWIAGVMGFGSTLALVLLTGVVGAALARREGLRVLRSWQRALDQGRVPEDGVVSGVLVLVGGVLLVTPGVLTDVVGFALLVPWLRQGVARIVANRIERSVQRGHVRVVSFSERPRAGRDGDGRDVIDIEGETTRENVHSERGTP